MVGEAVERDDGHAFQSNGCGRSGSVRL
jgi:hypothetical protein